MTKEEILEQLSFSVVKADKEMAGHAAQEVIEQKIDPVEAIEKGLSRGWILSASASAKWKPSCQSS